MLARSYIRTQICENGFATMTICHCVNDVCNSANNSQTSSPFSSSAWESAFRKAKCSILDGTRVTSKWSWLQRQVAGYGCVCVRMKLKRWRIFVRWWFSLVTFWHTNTNIASTSESSLQMVSSVVSLLWPLSLRLHGMQLHFKV